MDIIKMNTKLIKQFLFVNWLKTIWFNFRYFPFNQACKLPVIIARKVQVRYCYRGFCELRGGRALCVSVLVIDSTIPILTVRYI